MVGKHRALIAGALIVSLVGVQTPVLASTGQETTTAPPTVVSSQRSSAATRLSQSSPRVFSETALAQAVALRPAPVSASGDPNVLAQRYFGRYGRRGRRATALTAIVLGSAAAITGGALLAYANRPECSTSSAANGCGYGMKVVGGSVLAGGVVGVTLGALMWPR